MAKFILRDVPKVVIEDSGKGTKAVVRVEVGEWTYIVKNGWVSRKKR